jgi:hypothetical protein
MKPDAARCTAVVPGGLLATTLGSVFHSPPRKAVRRRLLNFKPDDGSDEPKCWLRLPTITSRSVVLAVGQRVIAAKTSATKILVSGVHAESLCRPRQQIALLLQVPS